jgi:hypothetical protein
MFPAGNWSCSLLVTISFNMVSVRSRSLLKTTVFWEVAPCGLVETDRHFRGCKFLQRLGNDEGSKHLWKAAIFTRLQLVPCGISYGLGLCSTHSSGEQLKVTARHAEQTVHGAISHLYTRRHENVKSDDTCYLMGTVSEKCLSWG